MVDRITAEPVQAELLGRIAAQDRQALAQLYDQTSSVLYSASMRILGDAHEAEEVIQDVFVQVWDKAASFDPAMGSPFNWVLSITRHRSIDRLRARQRRARLLTEWEADALSNPSPAECPPQSGLTEQELSAVRSAVGILPGEQKQAIEMAFFAGLTHLEIAESLQVPLGTIKARIRRGMLKLRETLAPYL
jgi:RNA polymerase sigma-70 factor (ECF subfamily)